MKYFLTLLICLNISMVWSGENPDTLKNTSANETSREKKIRIAKGVGLLSIEYIGGPLLAQKIWWQDGFYWDNPLKYIGEKETFLEDDAWHFAAGNIFTEFHYRVVNSYIKIKPVLISSILTFITLTGIESLDALDRKGKWMFSVNDEIANCLGIGFWIFKHYYPNIPVYVRVGVRKWSVLPEYILNGLKAVDDYNEYAKSHLDNYSTLKVECIYKFYNEFYGGVALSKKDGGAKENLFGLCIGYDYSKKVNSLKKGWWNTPVELIGDYLSFSFAFTLWLENK